MKRFAVFSLLCVFIFVLAGCNLLDTTGTVSGTVTDQNGDGIADVTVKVGGVTATSTNNGTYSLKVAMGSQTLTATADGYADYTSSVAVSAGQDTVHNIEMTALPGTLSGVVTDKETEAPIEGATITVGDVTVNSDPQGTFSMELAPGTYGLTAVANGYIAYNEEVTITADTETTHDIELTVTSGTLSGVVTDKETEAPIEGATITVGDVTVNSDPQGTFSMELAPGTYGLTAVANGYIAYNEEVTITADTETTYDIELTVASGTLRGVVTDKETEAPIVGATVTVADATVTTDDQGAYNVGLTPGSYTLTIVADGYVDYTASITITADEVTTHDVEMELATGILTGVVTEAETDVAIVGATITVADETVVTDDQGNYSVALLPGTYTLVAEADSYITYTASVTIVANEETAHDIEMTMIVYYGSVSGYVTDGRGGPAIEGATVTVEGTDNSTITDATGYFNLNIESDVAVDLLVQQENRASTRIQNVKVAEGENMEVEVPTRALFNPNWTDVPPTIDFSVNSGDELSGTETIDVSVVGDLNAFVFYVYLAGEQRYPYEGFNVDSNIGSFDIDTTLYPNGETYFKILAYDNNENGVLTYIPVTINNEADDDVLPSDIPVCQVETSTFGYNIGMYVEQRKEYFEANGIEGNPYIVETPKGSFNLESAPENAMILTRIYWDLAVGADGYHVYRSFDGENYEQIGSVTMGRYDDFSPALEANKTTYYQIIPYNSFGEGNPIERMTIPLPAHNVYLETPANDTTDVSLMPTFTWRNEFSETPEVGDLEFYAGLNLWDATDYQILATEVSDVAPVTEYTLPGVLAPNGVYSWDIGYSLAVAVLYYDVDGYVLVQSVAGEYTSDGYGTGSLNGEFIFRTTTDTIL